MTNKKHKWIIGILLFAPLVVLLSFYISPTAHAVEEGGDLSPWDILDGDLETTDISQSVENEEIKSSGGGSDKGSEQKIEEVEDKLGEIEDMEQEKRPEEKKEFENLITGKSIDSRIKEYENSLGKIKKSYSEVENEILRLEKVKAELEGRRAQELGSMEKFEELEKQIAELKEMTGKEQKFPLYPIITTNLVAVLLVFVFSKGRERKYQVERKW